MNRPLPPGDSGSRGCPLPAIPMSRGCAWRWPTGRASCGFSRAVAGRPWSSHVLATGGPRSLGAPHLGLLGHPRAAGPVRVNLAGFGI